jgi:DNA-binding CsgD family transcriptional regulator
VLRARRPADAAVLTDALAAIQRGLRRLVTLGAGSEQVSVALTPIDNLSDGGQPLSVLVVGRSRLCEPISVQWFARTHGLTPAESTVLELLSEGQGPAQIALTNAVGMATVRTQIKCIREKTRAASICDLMRLLALLPPMCSSLRC